LGFVVKKKWKEAVLLLKNDEIGLEVEVDIFLHIKRMVAAS
jgi:hypothetical protein